MARAIALNPQDDSLTGELITFSARVLFYGSDVPHGSDSSRVTFTVGGSDTVTIIRDSFAAAVKAEGQRLGYTLGNNSILLPAFIKV